MTDEYFVLMNDWHDDYQKKFYSGVFDTVCGNHLPINGSKFSFPYDVELIKDDTVYWNFDKYEELFFDYRFDKGHILSHRLVSILNDFSLSPHYKKNLSVWMQGKQVFNDYLYMSFKRGTWNKGVQLEPDFIFYDRDKSSFKLNHRGGIVPTGNISLTDNANRYDVFELLDTTCLSGFLVINEKVKLRLESEKMKIKGMKIVPINMAFKTYCADYNVSVDRLLPKVKKKIP